VGAREAIKLVEIPSIKTGDCSKDTTITDNHVQVMTALSLQAHNMALGLNHHISNMNDQLDSLDRKMERVFDEFGHFGKKLQEATTEINGVTTELKLIRKDYDHLKDDVDNIGGKVRGVVKDVRELDDKVHDAEGMVTAHEKHSMEKRLQEHGILKRMVLSPLVGWLVATVLGLALIGAVGNLKNVVAKQVEKSVEQALQKKGDAR
jgi:archaellum component FlaC